MEQLDEALIARVTEAVRARLSGSPATQPRALLIGDKPGDTCGFALVDAAPYEAVVIGRVGATFWMTFSDERVLGALACGIPVYYDEAALPARQPGFGTNRPLAAHFAAQERLLRQFGARPLQKRPEGALLTAAQARTLRAQGLPAPPGARPTPLALDILEGKSE